MADRLIYRGESVKTETEIRTAMGLMGLAMPYLVSGESPFICANGSLNFVGALLTAQHAEDYQAVLSEECMTHFKLRTPYTLDTLPLMTDGQTFPPTQILHKRSHAIGDKESGLVLRGPMTGMIVSFYDGHAVPERLFNDEPIPDDQRRYRPYTPIFVDDEDDGCFGLNQQLEALYKQHYYELVDRARRDLMKSQLWVSDLLFYMLREQNIGIDKKYFTSTHPHRHLRERKHKPMSL